MSEGFAANRSRADERALVLLALAAICGVACALVFARPEAQTDRLPAGWVARAGGRPILAEDYARAVDGFARDRREPPSDADRARILGTLIDEELLFQYGLSRGLVRSDRSVRDAVLRAMVESVVAESVGRAFAEDELRALYVATWPQGPASVPAPPFEAVRADLETMLAERARDEALRAQLDELRARARIERSEGPP